MISLAQSTFTSGCRLNQNGMHVKYEKLKKTWSIYCPQLITQQSYLIELIYLLQISQILGEMLTLHKILFFGPVSFFIAHTLLAYSWHSV